MAKEIKVTVYVNTVPHPNPQEAIDLIAKLVVDELINQERKNVGQINGTVSF